MTKRKDLEKERNRQQRNQKQLSLQLNNSINPRVKLPLPQLRPNPPVRSFMSRLHPPHPHPSLHPNQNPNLLSSLHRLLQPRWGYPQVLSLDPMGSQAWVHGEQQGQPKHNRRWCHLEPINLTTPPFDVCPVDPTQQMHRDPTHWCFCLSGSSQKDRRGLIMWVLSEAMFRDLQGNPQTGKCPWIVVLKQAIIKDRT